MGLMAKVHEKSAEGRRSRSWPMLCENVCERPRGKSNVVDNMILMRPTLQPIENKWFTWHKKMGYLLQEELRRISGLLGFIIPKTVKIHHYFPFTANLWAFLSVPVPYVLKA